jgi:benzodiazapine receptor
MTALDRVLPAAESPSRWTRRLADAAIVTTPLLVGGASSAFTMDGLRVWYRTIRKPDWNPPDWVFGPVWTSLYLMMGVALVQVARADRAGRDRVIRQVAIGLFGLQLALNFGWSWIFFTNHDLGGALVEIVALWLAIAATIVAFATIRRSAAALLIPYLAWTTFAMVLTATVWRLNR